MANNNTGSPMEILYSLLPSGVRNMMNQGTVAVEQTNTPVNTTTTTTAVDNTLVPNIEGLDIKTEKNVIEGIITEQFVLCHLHIPNYDKILSIQYPDTAKQLPTSGKGSRIVLLSDGRKSVTASRYSYGNYILTANLYTADQKSIENKYMNVFFVENIVEHYSTVPFCVVQFLAPPLTFHTTHFNLEIMVQGTDILYINTTEIHFRKNSKKKVGIEKRPPEGELEEQQPVKKPFVINKRELTLLPNSGPANGGITVQCVIENCPVESVLVEWDNDTYYRKRVNQGKIDLLLPPGIAGKIVSVMILDENLQQLSKICFFLYEKNGEISDNNNIMGVGGPSQGSNTPPNDNPKSPGNEPGSNASNIGNFVGGSGNNGPIQAEDQVLEFDVEFNIVYEMKFKEHKNQARINYNEGFQVDKRILLFQGGIGNYYKAQSKAGPLTAYYLKLFLSEPSMVKMLESEAKNLVLLDHPNVAKYYGYNIDAESYLILEDIPIRLFDWIPKSQISLPIISRFLLDVASGLAFLHSQNIQNIVLTSRRVFLDSQQKAKIFDFGLPSTSLLDISYSSRSLFESCSWTGPEYLEPKRIKERNEKGDIFGFGVIVWELVTKEIPWNKIPYLDVVHNVKHGARLEIPTECPVELKNLMQMCWNDDPMGRPKASELAHLIPRFS